MQNFETGSKFISNLNLIKSDFPQSPWSTEKNLWVTGLQHHIPEYKYVAAVTFYSCQQLLKVKVFQTSLLIFVA